MKRFIFNKEYFESEFMEGATTKEKLETIYKETGIGEESLKSKLIRNKHCRRINPSDYKLINKVDKYLILDTQKLIKKLILRANIDLTANEKFIIFIMLCCLDKGQEWVSIDELIKEIDDEIYNEKKMKDILSTKRIRLLFNFKEKEDRYSLNLKKIIKYSNYAGADRYKFVH